jgi:NADP-dependent 3-hydroxy acid dehydrogenase YdfG
MVTLDIVQSSNSHISSTLPEKLVAVFVGATSGIGEITLKKFAQYTIKPRVYFIGRSQEAGERIEDQCREINPAGEFTFIKADVSLIRVIDKVCETIKAKEKSINILFLSSGVITFDRVVRLYLTPNAKRLLLIIRD